MEPYEIQFPLSEESARELLWRALAPDATVLTPALNKAVEQARQMLGRPTEGLQLSSISVTTVNGVLYAELGYIPA
jgi:hypothetical protein